MALIDELLGKRKKGDNQPLQPVEPAPASPVSSGYVQNTTDHLDNQSVSELPIRKEDFDYLTKIGFSPDSIRKAYAPYNPSSNKGILENIYQLSTKKPVAPDEKKIRNAQTAAGIGDAITMLGQMWAAGKGANVRERSYDQSTSGQVSNRVRQLRDMYQTQSSAYDQGLYNARIKDFVKNLGDYEAGKKEIMSALLSKQKTDREQKNWQAKFDQAQENFEASQALKEQHNRETEAQGRARVQDAQNRTAAYIAKKGNTGSYQMILPARANDMGAQTDQFGNRVRTIDMTKGQIDAYARQALNDSGFMSRHPELILSKPDVMGSGTTKYKPNSDIAAAYLKEQYDANNKANEQPFDLSSLARPPYQGPLRNEEPDQWDEFEVSGF